MTSSTFQGRSIILIRPPLLLNRNGLLESLCQKGNQGKPKTVFYCDRIRVLNRMCVISIMEYFRVHRTKRFRKKKFCSWNQIGMPFLCLNGSGCSGLGTGPGVQVNAEAVRRKGRQLCLPSYEGLGTTSGVNHSQSGIVPLSVFKSCQLRCSYNYQKKGSAKEAEGTAFAGPLLWQSGTLNQADRFFVLARPLCQVLQVRYTHTRTTDDIEAELGSHFQGLRTDVVKRPRLKLVLVIE